MQPALTAQPGRAPAQRFEGIQSREALGRPHLRHRLRVPRELLTQRRLALPSAPLVILGRAPLSVAFQAGSLSDSRANNRSRSAELGSYALHFGALESSC